MPHPVCDGRYHRNGASTNGCSPDEPRELWDNRAKGTYPIAGGTGFLAFFMLRRG